MAPSTVNRPPRWWETAPTPYLVWNKSNKPVKGVKEDGGGSTRGQSRLSDMRMWHAVWARDEQVITALFEGDGADIVNEVDSLGNTPLHLAAFAGDDAIASLLLELGAHVNASNNAGDRPLHWAMAMEVGTGKQPPMHIPTLRSNHHSTMTWFPCWKLLARSTPGARCWFLTTMTKLLISTCATVGQGTPRPMPTLWSTCSTRRAVRRKLPINWCLVCPDGCYVSKPSMPHTVSSISASCMEVYPLGTTATHVRTTTDPPSLSSSNLRSSISHTPHEPVKHP